MGPPWFKALCQRGHKCAPHPFEDEVRQLFANGEYKTAKWGTICISLLAAAIFWYTPAAIGAGILAVPFAVTWLILYLPIRREIQQNRARVQRAIRLEARQYAADLESFQQRTELIKARNADRYAKWLAEDQRLELLRSGAPERNAKRLEEWMSELKRVESLREAVRQRNEMKRGAWLREIEEFKLKLKEIESHNAAIAAAMRDYTTERDRRHEHWREVNAQIGSVLDEWQRFAPRFASEFRKEFRQLEHCKSEYDRLQAEFENDRQRLLDARHEVQLRDHLGNTLIANASIQGIGKGRKATLAAYNIETALDINNLNFNQLKGSGIGRAIWEDLLAWKTLVIQGFRFHPTKAIPQHELRGLHMRYQVRKQSLQRDLRGGPERLRSIFARANDRLRESTLAAERLVPIAAQADADFRALAER